jgi:hypothetical protein
MRENRETPAVPEAVRAGWLVKALSYTTSAYAAGESHGGIVPAKGPNKGDKSLAEGLEGRLPAKESAGDLARTGRCAGRACPMGRLVHGKQHVVFVKACCFDVTHPRQEPYALKAHVRIRAGGAG